MTPFPLSDQAYDFVLPESDSSTEQSQPVCGSVAAEQEKLGKLANCEQLMEPRHCEG